MSDHGRMPVHVVNPRKIPLWSLPAVRIEAPIGSVHCGRSHHHGRRPQPAEDGLEVGLECVGPGEVLMAPRVYQSQGSGRPRTELSRSPNARPAAGSGPGRHREGGPDVVRAVVLPQRKTLFPYFFLENLASELHLPRDSARKLP